MRLVTDVVTDEEADAYIAAGRLLQSRQWPFGRRSIEKANGETYPDAVKRVIDTLTENELRVLRELVTWVRSYESESR